MTYTNRSYPPNSNDIPNGSYLTTLEETKNETLNHVPVGFYHDLIDNANDMFDACDQRSDDPGNIPRDCGRSTAKHSY